METNIEKKIVFEVPLGAHGLRLDKAICLCPEVGSRTRAAKLIELGLVTITGQSAKASTPVQAGQKIVITLPPPEESNLHPYEFKLDIVFEDKDLLVVNKPAGLVVHPAAGHAHDTLVNALINQATDLAMGFSEVRPGIVHRIDRDTSGLLVVAKNDKAQLALVEQFKAKSVHRRYWAIVHGGFGHSGGSIMSYQARHPVDRKRFASIKVKGGIQRNKLPIPKNGKWAVTHYEVMKTHSCGLSLIHLRLETGRTHQIRVHISEQGHPILGDFTYGSSKLLKQIKDPQIELLARSLNRFVLHAAELGFQHPTSGEQLLFKVGWPSELLPLVNALGFK